jgi:hypothetical protein
MMADARHRIFDTVVVFHFDRSGRPVPQLARALDEFRIATAAAG